MSIVVAARPQLLTSEGRWVGTVKDGASLGEIVDMLHCTAQEQSSLVVEINGHVVPAAQWNLTFPKMDTRVDVVAVYQGGDNGKMVLMAVAMIALTIASAGIGSGVAAYLSGTAMANATAAMIGTVVTASITIVGGLALTALFAPPEQSEAAAARQHYQIGSQSNRPRPNQGVMRIYGELRVHPDVIALPYRENIAGIEYLNTIYGYGYSRVHTNDIRIGSTDIHDYKGVDIATHPIFSAGDALTTYNRKVWQEPLSFVLKNDRDQSNILNDQPPLSSDEWVYISSESNTDRVELDFFFGQGLNYTDNSDNGVAPNNIEIWVSARYEGSSAWESFWTFFSAFKLESHPDIDAFKGTGKPQVDGGYPIHIKEEERYPFILTVFMALPASSSNKKIEFKIGRSGYTGGVTGGPKESTRDRSNCKLMAIRSIREIAPISPKVDIAASEIRIQATDQITGTVDSLSAYCQASVPVHHSSGAWTTQVTSNPAWIYLDILMGSANKKPLTVSEIDLQQFDDWAAYCDTLVNGEKFITCNFVHLGTETVDQLLQKVAACGNASRNIRDGKQSIIFDADAPYPTQIYTQRNSWGFNLSKTFIEPPHGLRVKYIDAADDYLDGEIIAYSPGYSASNAATFEDLEAFGCTDRYQAHRAGLRYLAMARYRSEIFTFNADIENIASERGDRIRVSYTSVKEGGVVGRIVAKTANSITLDQKHHNGLIKLVGAHGVEIRSVVGGAHIYHLRVASYSGDYVINTTDAVASSVQAGDLAVVGVQTEIAEDYIISAIIPGNDLTAQIIATPYAAHMQDAGNGGPKDPMVHPTTGVI